MADLLLILIPAVAAGLIAAWHGSIAAWALLASTALGCILRLAGAEFDWTAWLTVDLAVIAAIELSGPAKREHVIVPLMAVCWVLYQLLQAGHAAAGPAITIIVALQYVFVVPWDRLGIWTEKAA